MDEKMPLSGYRGLGPFARAMNAQAEVSYKPYDMQPWDKGSSDFGSAFLNIILPCAAIGFNFLLFAAFFFRRWRARSQQSKVAVDDSLAASASPRTRAGAFTGVTFFLRTPSEAWRSITWTAFSAFTMSTAVALFIIYELSKTHTHPCLELLGSGLLSVAAFSALSLQHSRTVHLRQYGRGSDSPKTAGTSSVWRYCFASSAVLVAGISFLRMQSVARHFSLSPRANRIAYPRAFHITLIITTAIECLLATFLVIAAFHPDTPPHSLAHTPTPALAHTPTHALTQQHSETGKLSPAASVESAYGKEEAKVEGREHNAGIVSRLFFQWLTRLIWKGRSNVILKKDIPPLRPNNRSAVVSARFDNCWQRSLEHHKLQPRHSASGQPLSGSVLGSRHSPSIASRWVIWRAIWLFLNPHFLCAWGLCLLYVVLYTLNPMYIKYLLQYMDSPGTSNVRWTEHVLPVLLWGLSLLLQSTLLQRCCDMELLLLERLRAALSTAVHRKVMRLDLSGTVASGVRIDQASSLIDGENTDNATPGGASGGEGAGGARYDTGQLLNFYSEDSRKVSAIAFESELLWSSPLQIAITTWLLYREIGWSALCGVSVLIISLPFGALVSQRAGRFQAQIMRRKDARMRVTHETLVGMRAVKLYAWEDARRAEIAVHREEELHSLWKLRMNMVGARIAVLSVPCGVAVAAFGFYTLVAGHTLTPTTAFTSIALFNALQTPLFLIPGAISTATDAFNSAKRLQAFLLCPEIPKRSPAAEASDEPLLPPAGSKRDPQEQDPPTDLALNPGGTTEVAVNDLGVCFDGKMSNAIFTGLTFRASSNDLVCIVGRTGAGKTALVDAILGEIPRATINGARTVLKGSVAYCGQTAWIMSGTVKDNILFNAVSTASATATKSAPDSHTCGNLTTEEDASPSSSAPVSDSAGLDTGRGRKMKADWYEKVLKASALEEDLKILVNGDMTEIGQRGINLSGGQKQRVALARALYCDADIVILDDVFSALDAHVAASIFNDAVLELLRDKCVLLVTHRIESLPHAKLIVFLSAEKGRPPRLFTSYAEASADPDFQAFTLEEERQKTKAKADAEASKARSHAEANGETETQYVDTQNIGRALSGAAINVSDSGFGGSGGSDMPRVSRGASGDGTAERMSDLGRAALVGVGSGMSRQDFETQAKDRKENQRLQMAKETARMSVMEGTLRRTLSRGVSSYDDVCKSLHIFREEENAQEETATDKARAIKMTKERLQKSGPRSNSRQGTGGARSAPEYGQHGSSSLVARAGSSVSSGSHLGSAPLRTSSGSGLGLGLAPGAPRSRSKAFESAFFLDPSSSRREGSLLMEGGEGEGGGAENNGKLFAEEEEVSGRVGWRIYRSFLTACGGWKLCLVVIFFLAACQSLSVGSNFWLSAWSSSAGTMSAGKGLGLYAGLQAIHVVLFAVADFLMAYGFHKSSFAFHDELVSRCLEATMTFFEKTPIGRLTPKFSEDLTTIEWTLPSTIRFLALRLLICASILVTIAVIFPWLILLLVPVAWLYFYVQRMYLSSARQIRRIERVDTGPCLSLLAETADGAKTLRAFHAFDAEKKFDAQQMRLQDARAADAVLNNTAARWLNTRLEIIGLVVVCAVALFTVLKKGTLKPAYAGIALAYSTTIAYLLNSLVLLNADRETQIISVENILSMSDPAACPQEKYTSDIGEDTPELMGEGELQSGEITFKKVSLRYRKGLPFSLKDVSFRIPSGQKVGIVGRTGAGKSSLAVVLMRLVPPTAGDIVVNGRLAAPQAVPGLRRQILVIPQDAVIFSGTIRSNVDPFGSATDEDIYVALKRACLGEFVEALADGIDHAVEEGGSNLSAGQRQLLCLARVLILKANILLLDEATSAVDPKTDALVQETIRKEFPHCTVLAIAHRLQSVIDYDVIFVMDQGRLVECGAPQALLQDRNSHFFQMYTTSSIKQ